VKNFHPISRFNKEKNYTGGNEQSKQKLTFLLNQERGNTLDHHQRKALQHHLQSSSKNPIS
jgi:Fe-S cluster biosynthesis and repair protein YggX